MKRTNWILTAGILAFGLQSFTASACTFFVDELAAQNDLAAKAISEQGYELADVNSINVEDYSWIVSIPSPMCPKELTHTANVSFIESTEEGQMGCSFDVSITRKDDWVTGRELYTSEVKKICE